MNDGESVLNRVVRDQCATQIGRKTSEPAQRFLRFARQRTLKGNFMKFRPEE